MRRKLLVAAQVAFVAAVLWFAGREIVGQWVRARESGYTFDPDWAPVFLSGVLVLAAYAVLIEGWRRLVSGWGSQLDFLPAARIWFVSNLGRYVPGKVWQIAAMATLATRENVSPVAATGSALLINLLNLIAGVGVVALTGARLLDDVSMIVAAVLSVGGLILLAPRILPLLARAAHRLTGRPIDVPRVPERQIWLATVACTVAWLLYGVAFRLLAVGVAPSAQGSVASYIAAFTASYLIGYIVLPAPGGLGARELALIEALGRLQLATGGAGALIVVASRLWLTVLEVLPGALYLALGTGSRRPGNLVPHDRPD